MEFFVFDKIQSTQNKILEKIVNQNTSIISKEAPWISQNTEDVIHLKQGYFRDSPSDTLTNFRDEVCDILKKFWNKDNCSSS